jgi:hypothetical protein
MLIEPAWCRDREGAVNLTTIRQSIMRCASEIAERRAEIVGRDLEVITGLRADDAREAHGARARKS